jgi:hypothetical protein
LTPGNSYEFLMSGSSYLDKTITINNLGCGSTVKAAEWYYSAAGAFTIWNSDGTKLADSAAAGAGPNQTEITSSATLNMRIEGVSDQSLGDLVVVVEATNTTEVKDLVVSGFNGVTKVNVPKFYAVNAAGSVAEAYMIPAVNFIDGGSATGSIIITAETGQAVNQTAFYVTAYKAQAYKDVDNTFKMGVEDSNGNVKYEGTFDFDFYTF